MVLCLKARESKSLPGLRNASFVSHLFMDLTFTVSLYDYHVEFGMFRSCAGCSGLWSAHDSTYYYLFYVCENNCIVMLTSL